MNLKEIVQEINSALDYNPDIKAYTDQVVRVVNRHYLQVSGQYPWKFMQKTEDIILRPDISGSADNRLQVFVGSRGETDIPSVSRRLKFKGDSQAVVTTEMEGQHLVLDLQTRENAAASTPSASSYKTTPQGAGGFGQDFLITRAVIGRWDPSGPSGSIPGLETAKNYVSSGTDDGGTPLGIGGTGSEHEHMSVATVTSGKTNPSPYYIDTTNSYIVIESEMSEDLFAAVNDADVAAGTRSVDDKTITTDWKIEFRRFPLPKDCAEVLSFMDRGASVPAHSVVGGTSTTTKKTSPDKGRLVFIDSKKEEYLFLDRDSSGDPMVAVEDEWMHLEAPSVAPLLQIDDSIKGMFSTGQTYQYCYTFLYAGGESPPSPVAEIAGQSGYAIRVYGLEDTSSSYGKDGETGRIKRLYRRLAPDPKKKNGANVNTGSGPWLHVVDLTEVGGTSRVESQEYGVDSKSAKVKNDDKEHNFWDQGSTKGDFGSFSDSPFFAAALTGAPDSQDIVSKFTYHGGDKYKLIRLDEHGPRQWIRVYRPPSDDMKIQVRYLAKPRRMVSDNDYPNWPPQYHHLLVYLSLSDICMQHGMTTQSQLYERKAQQLLDRMRQKYLSSPARQYIRRGFDARFSSGERWGTPTKI
tara:strand:+ start:602 stop:2503 length:1902 start_codon:yes stop_codon:yes gene_type:complete